MLRARAPLKRVGMSKELNIPGVHASYRRMSASSKRKGQAAWYSHVPETSRSNRPCQRAAHSSTQVGDLSATIWAGQEVSCRVSWSPYGTLDFPSNSHRAPGLTSDQTLGAALYETLRE